MRLYGKGTAFFARMPGEIFSTIASPQVDRRVAMGATTWAHLVQTRSTPLPEIMDVWQIVTPSGVNNAALHISQFPAGKGKILPVEANRDGLKYRKHSGLGSSTGS